MSISPLPPNLTHLFNPEPVRAEPKLGASSGFENILTEAFRTVGKTDADDKGSALELLMGESDDFAGLLIDAQKAELSLQLALQIRNKVIDAYNEVMRMSV